MKKMFEEKCVTVREIHPIKKNDGLLVRREYDSGSHSQNQTHTAPVKSSSLNNNISLSLSLILLSTIYLLKKLQT